MTIEILLGALAEAIFGLLAEDLAQRHGLAELRGKLRGTSPEKLALQRALTVTYIAFARNYPSLAASFFDDRFIQRPEVVREFSKFLTPNQSPDQQALERAWRNQFFNAPQIDLGQPVSDFLDMLEREVKAQPQLKPFTDGRAFDQLYLIAQRDEQQVKIQGEMRNLLVDIRDLLARFAETDSHTAQLTPDVRPPIEPDIRRALIGILLLVPALQDRNNRNVLLHGLDELGSSITRSNVPVADIVAIVDSLAAVEPLKTTKRPLAILMCNARLFCSPNTELGRQLTGLMTQYQRSWSGLKEARAWSSVTSKTH